MSHHTVMVVLTSHAAQSDALKQALLILQKHSQAEAACLSYRIHQDISNPCVFFLYETWLDQKTHQAQFTKPYIQDFAKQCETLLSKSFEFIFAKEILASEEAVA